MSRASSSAPAESLNADQEEADNLATEQQNQLIQSLSTHEKLLVAQAVYEKGGDDWQGVAKLLKGHALLKTVFGAKRCEEIHGALTRELGLEIDLELPPQAPQLLKIARKWYLERVYELRELMQQEQDRFLIAYAEIEEIKAGKHDDQIHLSAPPPSHSSSVPTTLSFPGLISPDLSKPAPLPMFAFPPPSATPAKKGRGGKRAKVEKPRDEWLDWKPQGMPETQSEPQSMFPQSSLGVLPPLPDMDAEGGGMLPMPPMGLQFGGGLALPALPDLPPLPDLPALPDLGGDAMEGVEGV